MKDPKFRHYIKINVPTTEEEYVRGNGEGMWALTDDSGKRAYDEDAESGEYEVIIDNDSFFWEGLEHGQLMPVEMRGVHRPIVPYNWLFAIFGKC